MAYASGKVWVDQDRYVPLKKELFAKSGQLLKRSTMSEVSFNRDIPAYLFSKAALKQ